MKILVFFEKYQNAILGTLIVQNKKKLSKSYNLGKKILSLPISEEHTAKEIRYVCSVVKIFFKAI